MQVKAFQRFLGLEKKVTTCWKVTIPSYQSRPWISKRLRKEEIPNNEKHITTQVELPKIDSMFSDSLSQKVGYLHQHSLIRWKQYIPGHPWPGLESAGKPIEGLSPPAYSVSSATLLSIQINLYETAFSCEGKNKFRQSIKITWQNIQMSSRSELQQHYCYTQSVS